MEGTVHCFIVFLANCKLTIIDYKSHNFPLYMSLRYSSSSATASRIALASCRFTLPTAFTAPSPLNIALKLVLTGPPPPLLLLLLPMGART